MRSFFVSTSVKDEIIKKICFIRGEGQSIPAARGKVTAGGTVYPNYQVGYGEDVVGGGGCMIQNFGEYGKSRVTIVQDICATVKGYEAMTMRKIQRIGEMFMTVIFMSFSGIMKWLRRKKQK